MNFLTPETLVGWALLAGTIAIAAAAAFGIKNLIPVLDANLKGKLYDTLRSRAHTFVAALMQDPTLKGLASEEKKQQAMIWMMDFAGKAGIELSNAEASRLIEEAVYLLKTVVLSEVVEATG